MKTEVLNSTYIPFTDLLLQLRKKHTVSFHALPLSHCQSIAHSHCHEKYLELFGKEFLQTDVTYAGTVLDSPVLPRSVLKKSQEITAEAFGADSSLYITMGTTMANSIVCSSLIKRGERVLVDRSCHQSIHFTLKRLGCQMDYIRTRCINPEAERYALDIDDLIEKYSEARRCGQPYRLVVLNSLSYEGVFYDLQHLIEQCVLIEDDVNFLIDEAWSAYFYFHPWYQRFSAMRAAKTVKQKIPSSQFTVVSTQSIHKSLSGIRQASLIHVHGSKKKSEQIESVKYTMHTTSPSYPILCSIELARAQATLEGEQMIEQSLRAGCLFQK